jgi:Fe-S-cluster-containing dehydrogenase component
METCPACGDRLYGNEGPYCYHCTPDYDTIVTTIANPQMANQQLGQQVFDAIVNIAQRIADRVAREKMKDHEESNEHERKSPW